MDELKERPLLSERQRENEARDRLADTPTPKAQEGEWTLTAPDGRTWKADSPLKCCAKELRERVPADVSLARIFREADAHSAEGRHSR